MQIKIIINDGYVSVDGVEYNGLDLSFVHPGIHAIQWNGEIGEVEVKDPVTKKMIANIEIHSIDQYQPVLDAWKRADDAAKAAREAAQIAAANAALTEPTP